MEHLVVVRPFGLFRVGDVVADQAVIARVVASEHGDHVVRVVLAQGD